MLGMLSKSISDYDTTYVDDFLDETQLNNFIITNLKVLGCRDINVYQHHVYYSMVCYNVRQIITKEKIIYLENENERLIQSIKNNENVYYQSIKNNENVYYHIIFLICSMWGFSVYLLLKYGLNI